MQAREGRQDPRTVEGWNWKNSKEWAGTDPVAAQRRKDVTAISTEADD
jgi:hypothetical protein